MLKFGIEKIDKNRNRCLGTTFILIQENFYKSMSFQAYNLYCFYRIREASPTLCLANASLASPSAMHMRGKRKFALQILYESLYRLSRQTKLSLALLMPRIREASARQANAVRETSTISASCLRSLADASRMRGKRKFAHASRTAFAASETSERGRRERGRRERGRRERGSQTLAFSTSHLRGKRVYVANSRTARHPRGKEFAESCLATQGKRMRQTLATRGKARGGENLLLCRAMNKESSAINDKSFGNDSESRTIVVTSGKGGVGKTTTTANLGMSIARLGYRVALIDADIGLRNLDLLLGLENRVLYTAMDIFEGECRLDQALIRDKRLKNLSLLAISKNRQRYNVTRQKMESLVSSIAALGYQFVLIDCPAGIDVGFINAISPAQEALIVTTPEITAMRDADRVAGLLEANGIYNAKLLINRVRPDMIQRHDMMSVQDVQDVLGIPLLGAIPEDLNVIVSTNRGEPLVLRKKLTLSGIAFENAARRLIGKQDYVIDLKTPYKSFLQKIQSIFTE